MLNERVTRRAPDGSTKDTRKLPEKSTKTSGPKGPAREYKGKDYAGFMVAFP